MTRLLTAALLVLATASASFAATKYWDINGATPGTGFSSEMFSDGPWDTTTTNWSTSAAGDVAPDVWVAGDDAVFSAGTDAVDALITMTAGMAPASVVIEEGNVGLNPSGAALGIGGAPITVKQGAKLSFSGITILGATAGHVLTLDGGTVRNSVVGIGSSFYPSPVATPTQILLTSNGGTLEAPNGASDSYSIVQYGAAATATAAINAAVIGMTPGTTSATLRKTGAGEFRALKNWTFTKLEVQQGLYRIIGDSPSPTPGPGFGGGETGFGAATGTVETFGGAVENTTNGSAIGTSMTLTGANASPATRSFILGGTGDSMFVLNAGWTINGPVSGPGGLMLNGWARNDGGGSTNIIGSQAQVLTLGGSNSYAGPTTINFGTLAAAGGSAVPDTSRVKISTRSAWGGNNGVNTPTAGPTITTLNTAVFRVDASETIGSLEGGNATRGLVTINGSAVELSVGADNTSTTYSGGIGGAGALRKIGTGTLTLDGLKTYTGDTKIEAGTLSTTTASLADAADLYLSAGSMFDLNFTGTDIIDSLFIGGVSQAVGTWGGAGSGATNISPLLSGTGLLQVTTLVSAGVVGDYSGNGTVGPEDYTTWSTNFGTTNVLPNLSPTKVGNVIDASDYTVWRDALAGPSAAGAAAVPEPATIALLLGSLAMVFRLRK